ncbi:MAG: serine/threonine-protein kinase [Gammaproteobacteria bacterium]|nr:serine/threonine-protein kinase [Gammaproteobacteria bacterium]
MVKKTPRPKKISKYLIKRTIGKGSMGVVYEAYDPFVQRPVAIKLAHEFDGVNAQQAQQMREGFFGEVYSAGRMHHPSVTAVYDAGQQDKWNYIVMEYVDGETLQEYVTGDRVLNTNQIIDVMYQCAKGLDYVHRQGVIHRDLKPGNIMLSIEGEVKIMDFSIAHFDMGDSEVSQVQGSPMYLPPEQLTEEKILVEQSDIYSLGAVMYALLARRPLFKASNLESLMYQITNLEPDPLSVLRPDVPQQVIDICEKCLKKKIDDRYESAQQLATELSKAYGRLRGVGQRIDMKEKWATLRYLKFFKDFSDEQITEVVDASEWYDYKKGELIVSEGEIETSFYIITKGGVEVMKEDVVIGRMYQGDCFGEIAFITREPRQASIRARTDVSLMVVSGTLLEKASVETQLQYYRIFLENLIARLSSATAQLTEQEKLKAQT